MPRSSLAMRQPGSRKQDTSLAPNLALERSHHARERPIPSEPDNPVPSSTPDEPTPMLDVHPAHHPASTWRDFFIHIITIVTAP
jgi:hypothetical protein